MLASGPYTPDTKLDFSALEALCDQAISSRADCLILSGPFIDLQHPAIISGDIDTPPHISDSPTATLTDIFRHHVSLPLQHLAESVPTITILLVPSTRDAVNKHVSWPQDRFNKKELGLPRQAMCITNPCTLSLNEIVLGISAQDILSDMRGSLVSGGKWIPPADDATQQRPDTLARLSRAVLSQRHFYPLFPPPPPPPPTDSTSSSGIKIGASIDTRFLKLGEWLNVRPDMLILPSGLAPFAKVVDGVVVVNPGSLSRKKAPGTFARMIIRAAKVDEGGDGDGDADGMVSAKVWDRCRVDIVRI